MKKVFCLTILFILGMMPVFAYDTDNNVQMSMQKRINEIGFKILNANMLDKRVTFSVSEKKGLKDPLIKHQILISQSQINQTQNDDELAALLARQISSVQKSYSGAMGGFISTLQIKMSPKKYELVEDKAAVDYLVKAGYNPLALITYINKTCPQAHQDRFSRHNLTSKRLMYIYERIYFDYPVYIVNNEYIQNQYYQNFLLTSLDNRRKLDAMAKRHERGKIKYE